MEFRLWRYTGAMGVMAIMLASSLAAQVPEVIYYPFNEGTGTTTANLASPGQGAAVANLNTSMTWQPTGQFGTAISAPGATTSTNAISTGWIPNWPSTTPQSWTIEFWINGTTGSTTLWYVFGCVSASSWRCFTNGVAGTGNLMLRGPVADVTITGCWDGTWHHVAWVYDSAASQIRAYLDGQLVNTVAQGTVNIVGSADFLVGGYGTNFGLNGSMDDFRVWSVARTGAQIAAGMRGEMPPGEIDVLRGTTSIADGEPNHALGNVPISTGQTFTFTIANSGPGSLYVVGSTAIIESVSGASVSVTQQPSSPVAASGNTTFDVFVQPGGAAAFSFQVRLENNDEDEATYTFVCQGMGIVNAPPTLVLAATTDFVAGGDFDLTVAPGAGLAGTNGAHLTVSDATPDPVDATITFSTGPMGAIAPTGIVQPANVTAGAGAGFTLTWTGTADATNDPGTYEWDVDLSDGISLVSYTVRIIITNAAPAHVAAGTATGDGSSGTPYAVTASLGSAAGIAVATVSDANTGQDVSLFSQASTASPGGSSVTFTFALSPAPGNPATLSATPSGAPALADLGNYDYTIIVEDDSTPTPVQTTLYVTITVSGTAPSITSAAAPGTATATVLYTHTFTASGNPTPTFAVTAGGPLPLWLSLVGDTLSGTPTAGDVGTVGPFTVSAQNGIAPDDTEVITIVVSLGTAPTITSAAAPTTATVGSVYSHTFTATGNPTPTLSATGLPAWLTFTPATGLLTGTPASGDVGTAGPITITASNGVLPNATEAFSITVSASGSGGGGGGKDSDGGCSLSGKGSVLLLGGLVLVAMALRRRRMA